ncbi:MAG: PIG-L deacetylase family protein [Acidimicrobiales bacterium]
MDQKLSPLPEDWQRAIAVVAHPDDLEYGASAAVARWTSQNKDVRYVLATRGEAGIDSIPPERAGPLRTKEQEASAATVGVSVVEFLDHPDGMVMNTLGLRRDLAASIRHHRPEVIIASNYRLRWGESGPWNHVDHRELGSALPDAVRDAANRWLFTDAGEPWAGVRWIAYASSTAPTHAVDVTDSFDAGVASLECHRTYIEALADPDFDPDSFLRANAAAAGASLGVQLAVTFELVPA